MPASAASKLEGALGELRRQRPLLAQGGERGHQRHPHRARAAQPRAGRRLAAGQDLEAARGTVAPRRGLEQAELAVGPQLVGAPGGDGRAKVERVQADAAPPRPHLRVGVEVDGHVDHRSARGGAVRRDVGPPAGQVDPERRPRVADHRPLTAPAAGRDATAAATPARRADPSAPRAAAASRLPGPARGRER